MLVKLHGQKIFVDQVIAKHPRYYERYQMFTILDHYLEALIRKPRAIRDAHAFHSPDIPEVFRRFHQKMREQEGAIGIKNLLDPFFFTKNLG